MSKRIRARLALDRYDEKKGEDVCPGEEACSWFAMAVSDCGDGLEACVNCRKLPSKLTRIERSKRDESDRKFDRVIDRIDAFKAHRAATGEPLDLEAMTSVEYAGIIATEWLTGLYEQEARTRMRIALEENLQMTAAIIKAFGGMK